jgi:hypothetical protein
VFFWLARARFTLFFPYCKLLALTRDEPDFWDFGFLLQITCVWVFAIGMENKGEENVSVGVGAGVSAAASAGSAVAALVGDVVSVGDAGEGAVVGGKKVGMLPGDIVRALMEGVSVETVLRVVAEGLCATRVVQNGDGELEEVVDYGMRLEYAKFLCDRIDGLPVKRSFKLTGNVSKVKKLTLGDLLEKQSGALVAARMAGVSVSAAGVD